MTRRPGTIWFRAAAAAAVGAAFGQVVLFYAVADVLAAPLQPGPQLARWIAAGAVGIAAKAAFDALAALLAARGAAEAEHAARRRLLPAILPAAGAVPAGGAVAGGATASRALLEEPGRAADAASRWVPARLEAAVVPAVVIAFAFAANWLVGLILLLAAPLIPLNMAVFGLGARHVSERQATTVAELGDLVLDRVKGAATLRAFGAAGREAAVVRAAADDLARRTMAVLRIALGSSAALEAMVTYAVAVAATYIGLVLLRYVHVALAPTSLDLRGGLFLLLLAPAFFQPFRDLAAAYHDRQDAEAAVGILAARLSPPVQGQNTSPERIAVSAPGPAVCCRGVTFRFPDSGANLLSGLDWDVPRGALVGVTGPSGAGKSTLLRLVAGRLAPSSGAVAREGGQMAWVGQRPYFFQGTIADNLRVADPGAAEDSLWLALRAVGLADVVAALPGGLSAELTWRGGGLSGGQAHRVAIARALLSDASVILLDEPTASLDPAAEAALAGLIAGLVPARTVVVASHSPAVLDRCSAVLSLGGPDATTGGASERKEHASVG